MKRRFPMLMVILCSACAVAEPEGYDGDVSYTARVTNDVAAIIQGMAYAHRGERLMVRTRESIPAPN